MLNGRTVRDEKRSERPMVPPKIDRLPATGQLKIFWRNFILFLRTYMTFCLLVLILKGSKLRTGRKMLVLWFVMCHLDYLAAILLIVSE